MTAAFVENSTGAVYQAAATDPDGDSITYRIAGADAARFTLSASGLLSFTSPPDFEVPGDADANNVYQVTVLASDGRLETGINLSISVSNTPDFAVLRLLGSGFLTPVDVAPVLGSTRMFVTEAGGRIYQIDPANPQSRTLYLTVQGAAFGTTREIDGVLSTDIDGVLSIAPAPDFATSGLLYVYLVNLDGDLEIRRYRRLPSGLGDDASADVVLKLDLPTRTRLPSLSRGGGLAFGPDNNLYVGTGDGRPPNTPSDGSPQNLASLLGKVLRIDVSRDDFPNDPERDYATPADNPRLGGASEIYAYGLENPRTMNFDGSNLYVGDAHARDGLTTSSNPNEIHLLRPQDAGANFGYGAAVSASVIPPVIILPSGSSNGFTRVTVGPVYRGPVASLVGRLVFADTQSARIWSVLASSVEQGSTITLGGFRGENALLSANPPSPDPIEKFGVDAAGNLYLVQRRSGEVYILEAR
jgi:hypothetical protein